MAFTFFWSALKLLRLATIFISMINWFIIFVNLLQSADQFSVLFDHCSWFIMILSANFSSSFFSATWTIRSPRSPLPRSSVRTRTPTAAFSPAWCPCRVECLPAAETAPLWPLPLPERAVGRAAMIPGHATPAPGRTVRRRTRPRCRRIVRGRPCRRRCGCGISQPGQPQPPFITGILGFLLSQGAKFSFASAWSLW